MQHSKRIDQIEWAIGQPCFRIGNPEASLRAALPRKGDAFAGKVNGINRSSGLYELKRVGAYPAADLEHVFASPSFELSKARYVWLDKILSFRNFQAPALTSHGSFAVPDVARPSVPVRCNRFNLLQQSVSLPMGY